MGGCTQKPPLSEYTLAKTALDAAQSAGSPKFAPGLWYKAEENYRSGENAFRKGDYEEAKNYFDLSVDYSEKAENKARFDKKRLGDDLP